MKTSNKKRKKLFEDIYDLIAETKWEKEAKENLRKFIKNKNIEWDGDNNIISLGKYFKFKLLD